MKKNVEKIFDPGQGKFISVIKFVSFLFTKPGFSLLKRVTQKKIRGSGLVKQGHTNYNNWIKAKLDHNLLKRDFEDTFSSLKYRPKISVIISTGANDNPHLQQAANSVFSQLYDNWELCIATHSSGFQSVKDICEKCADNDRKIKITSKDECNNIADCGNAALSTATGEYVLFMSGETILTPNCLFEFLKYINANPSDKVIYSDEDKIDEEGIFFNPFFKPGWSPDSILSRNYIGNCFLIKKDTLSQLSGLREGFEGSEYYDLLLRATERTNYAGHIPKILCHLRDSNSPVTDTVSAKKTLHKAMVRRGTPAIVEGLPGSPGYYRIRYEVRSFDKVSIIIPSKDHAGLLKTALDSILLKTDYDDYEIIVLNNNSSTEEFAQLMTDYKEKYGTKFRCIDACFPFNFCRLINTGVAESKGDYILMFNNDLEVISNDWLKQMVSYAQYDKTGAVGVKLLYPNDTIQHAGIVLGIKGDAGHIFANMPRETGGYFNCVASVSNYAAVTGACLMCRKNLFNEVGGMDEQLEVEYNDFDFCLKLLKRGHYNVYLPDVELYHFESATRGHPFRSKQSWEQHEKDLAIFRNKWQSIIDNDPYYNPNLSLECTDFRLTP